MTRLEVYKIIVDRLNLDVLHDDTLDLIIERVKEIKEQRRQAKINRKNPNQYELFNANSN